MDNQFFTAVIKEEDRVFVALCQEIGTASQGNTIEGAIKNLREATELYLEEFPIRENSNPVITVFQVNKNGNI